MRTNRYKKYIRDVKIRFVANLESKNVVSKDGLSCLGDLQPQVCRIVEGNAYDWLANGDLLGISAQEGLTEVPLGVHQRGHVRHHIDHLGRKVEDRGISL